MRFREQRGASLVSWVIIQALSILLVTPTTSALPAYSEINECTHEMQHEEVLQREMWLAIHIR